MDMVQLRNLADYESLQRDRWGIPSINPGTVHERVRILGGPDAQHSDKATLDLLLMPGVAFDIDPQSGLIRRCGHGKGFYDFFIDRYGRKLEEMDPEQRAPFLLYGLALAEQFIPASSGEFIPTGSLDRPLDGVLSGDGQIRLRSPPE
jgi:5-formyltetrahydrofolate cyclo-ligase